MVITAIGKPGHTVAEWVLDELRGSLPDADLVMGRMEGDLDWYSQDQVAAAAELGVLCRADHVVLTSGSTFSWFAHNWREAAGISASLEQTIGNSSWRNTTEGMQACRDIGSHAIMPMHLTIRCPRPCGSRP